MDSVDAADRPGLAELTGEALSFVRRSSLRLSRRAIPNRLFSLGYAEAGSNRSLSNIEANKTETSHLFNMLNKDFETNRELPTAHRTSLLAMSSVELSEAPQKSKFESTNHDQATTSSIKRHSSVGSLNVQPSIDEIPRDSSIKESSLETTETASAEQECENSIVTLRRSSSISEVDLNAKFNFRRRREITSAILPEESTEESQERIQSRSSCRLSGLKKLGSLYKTFEEDEYTFNSRQKPTNSGNNDVDDKECNENELKSSLDAKRAIFEKKSNDLTFHRGSLVISDSSSSNDLSKETEGSCLLSRNSKIRHSMIHTSSVPTSDFILNSIVSNRIMKFETQMFTQPSNPVPTVEPTFSRNFPAPPLLKKSDNPIRVETDNTSTSNSICTSPVLKFTPIEVQQKVKSLSKNFELIAHKNAIEPTNQPPSSTVPKARPSTFIEKIEKFNQVIQIFPEENLSASNLASPSPHDLDKDRIDENETSKDDGFETQSNASSSQTSDCANQPSRTITEQFAPIEPAPKPNPAPEEIAFTDIKSSQQVRMSMESVADSIATIKPNEIVKERKSGEDKKNKGDSKNRNSKQISTIVTIVTTRNKTAKPNLINGSSSNKKSSKPVMSTSTKQLSSIFGASEMNFNEANKKKSGSMSGLYLSETTSTKAKKSESKQQQVKDAALKIANNIKEMNASYNQLQVTNCGNVSSSSFASIGPRRNSLTKKSIEKLNLYSGSSISLPVKESNLIASTKVCDSGVSPRKSSSVFDRLTKSNRKI